ncbi:MAG: hypothetical protein AAF641_00805 [Pseudomonadota bacterium]
MSDLTPGGDLFSDAGIAIRSFLSNNPNGLSEREVSLMSEWIRDCKDPANVLRLTRVMHGLSVSR